MNIINGTQHEITIYSIEGCTQVQGGRKLLLNEGVHPVYVSPPGTNLNAVKGNKAAPTGDYPFAVKGAVEFAAADPIPEGNLVVVSNLYRAACAELGRDTSRLGTVDGTVYVDESAIRPCGCTAIAVG